MTFDGDLDSFTAVVFFGSSAGLMLGRTPPWAMVTPARNFPSSSSLRIASRTWPGMMRFFLLLRCVPGQLQRLRRQVLGHGRQLDRRTSAGRSGPSSGSDQCDRRGTGGRSSPIVTPPSSSDRPFPSQRKLGAIFEKRRIENRTISQFIANVRHRIAFCQPLDC